MRPNCRSSGIATAEAMVSGLAPGSAACTWMVGNSTCGSGATGSWRKATQPASASAAVSSDVPTGRRMKGAEMPVTALCRLGVAEHDAAAPPPEAPGEAVEGEVDDRRRVEGEDLAHEEPAHDGDAERPAQLGAGARAEGERQPAQQRRPLGVAIVGGLLVSQVLTLYTTPV